MNELKAFEHELGDQRADVGDQDGSVNLLTLLNDRMHGRWKWAIALGITLGGAFAVAGFRLATVSYSARGLVQVEQDLPEIVEETPETRSLQNFDGFLGTQATLMRDGRVLADALRSDDLQSYLSALGEDPQSRLASGLSVGVVRGTDLISVEYTSEDRRLAQAAVNAVLDSYESIYGPNSELSHTQTTQRIRTLLTDARRQVADLLSERERIEAGSEVLAMSIADGAGPVATRIVELQAQLDRVEELRERIESEAAEAGRPVGPNDVAEPTEQDLLLADPSLESMLASREQVDLEVRDLASRLSDQHPQMKRARIRLENLDATIEERMSELRETWSESMRATFGYAALGEEVDRLAVELSGERDKIDRFRQEQTRLQTIREEIATMTAQVQTYESRLRGLEIESDVIRGGRITIRYALLPTGPSRDRRIQYSVAGFMGGLGASLAGFFLLGTLDRRAFASRQLESDRSRFMPLGVVPDMSRLGDSDEERVLLEDCVHRVRNRLEVRRMHGDRGFALNVSSPFQGDGKTSVAAALAWSYAQAGYRTVMVDADFIGRALSHQFGLLGAVGVREAMRDPETVLSLIQEARPNLDILPVGSDRDVSAGHLQPAAMRTLLERLRDHYEIVVVDSGPMTASVESLPIMGSVDGVMLVLRRGRNRNRLRECISDIRHVGVAYLGVVLNYATLADCQRYSSLSRTSAELEQGPGERPQVAEAVHPVVSALGSRRPHRD